MESITLQPQEVRDRFKSHFDATYGKNRKKQNDAFLSNIISRKSCHTLPFINHQVLDNLLNNCPQTSMTIVEEVGEKDRLNEWEHQHETFESAKASIRHRTQCAIDDAKKNLIFNKKMFSVFKFLYHAHLLNEAGRNNVGGLLKLLDWIEKYEVSDDNLEFFPLTERKIPAHIPALNDEFWVAGLHMQPVPTLTHCKVTDLRAYDHGAEDGLMIFNAYLGSVDDNPDERGFSINEDNLKNSDGKVYGLGMQSYTAYKNKADAVTAMRAYANLKYNQLKDFI